MAFRTQFIQCAWDRLRLSVSDMVLPLEHETYFSTSAILRMFFGVCVCERSCGLSIWGAELENWCGFIFVFLSIIFPCYVNKGCLALCCACTSLLFCAKTLLQVIACFAVNLVDIEATAFKVHACSVLWFRVQYRQRRGGMIPGCDPLPSSARNWYFLSFLAEAFVLVISRLCTRSFDSFWCFCAECVETFGLNNSRRFLIKLLPEYIPAMVWLSGLGDHTEHWRHHSLLAIWFCPWPKSIGKIWHKGDLTED